ncbi:MAG: thioesterase family protein [Alistipes sp.]
MAQTLEIPIQKRFSDVDSFMHVNNVAQQMYFDLGKTDYYQRILHETGITGRARVITVSTTTSYLQQIRMDDNLFVTTTAEQIGTKSIHLLQRLICRNGDKESIHSESRSVMVAFDFDRQLSFPVPEEWRAKMLSDEIQK